MNCGSICRKVTTIRWSLSYHYDYIWLVTVTKSPSSKWSPPVTVAGSSHSPGGLIPTKHSPPQESTPSEEGLGEVPVLDASPSCHFTIASPSPSLEINSLLETQPAEEAKGSQCADRHKLNYRVKVVIFHAQNQKDEALMLQACR